MEKLLENIEKYLIYAVVLLLPITVYALSPNPFDPAKLAIITFGISLVLLIKAIRVINSGRLDFSTGTFDFPVLLIAVAYVASTILRTPNKFEAFLLPGTATAVITGALLYYLINQLSEREKKTSALLLFISGLIFSVITIFASLNVFSKIPQLPVYVRDTAFNPAGGLLPAVILLATLIPLGISFFVSERVTSKKLLWGTATAVLVLATILSIIKMLPGKPTQPRLLGIQTSWAISIDSLKESPILGVGPGNYLTAFNRFRPLAHNTTDLWAIKFGSARDYYLTLFTETGLLGVAGLILLFLAVYRIIRGKFASREFSEKVLTANTNLFSLTLLIILLALFPATILLIALLFILLSLASTTKKSTLNLSTQVIEAGTGVTAQASQRIASRLPALLVTLPVIIGVILFSYQAGRALAAERKYKLSLDALVANNAVLTYDTMREAINLNPRVDRYHTSYAQVNLAIANSIAGVAEITDQDRANIAQLIQQAIREGKATVALNPLRAGNWEVLARIYRALIPFAQGADAFAIQSYAQAVALDPINPNLRIDLGGVHYAQGNYDTAIRIFEMATVAKSDLANAHYNLAFALREDGKIDRAISEMTIVLSLVDRGTQDYEAARQALENLEERRAAATPEAGEELFPPQPAEEPVIKPPIELPEEAEPPEAPTTPTPTPTPTEEPTPTPTIEP